MLDIASAFDIEAFLKTNLFWFAFLVPGLAAVRLTNGIRESDPQTIPDRDTSLLLIRSFAYSSAILAPVALSSYILHWSLLPALLFFGMALLAGTAYLGYHLFGYFKKGFKANFRIDILLLLLTAGLVFDYVLTALVGNYPFGDTRVHLAKILKTIISGPFITDPLTGANTDVRYHYNLVHVVYAVGAKITGLAPSEFWKYSASFFRMLYWLTALATFTFLFRKKHLPYLLTIVFMILYFPKVIYASYPNVAWMFLFFMLAAITLSAYLDNENSGKNVWKTLHLAEFTAFLFLIGFVHPLYVLFAVGFFGLLLSLFAAARVCKVRDAGLALPAMIPPLFFTWFTYNLPHYFKDELYEISKNKFITFGGKIIAVQYNQGKIDLGVVLLLAAVILAMFMLKSRARKGFLVTLLAFPILLLNTPVMGLLLNMIPFWAINRVSFLGVFSKVIMFLPFFMFMDWLRQEQYVKRTFMPLTLLVLFLLMMPFSANLPAYARMHRANQETYDTYKELASFKNRIEKGKLVVAPPDLAVKLPGTLGVKILSLTKGMGHWNPGTPDIEKRIYAMNALFNGNPQYAADYLTKPSYLIVDSKQKLKSKLFMRLKLLHSSPNYRLFEILSPEEEKGI